MAVEASLAWPKVSVRPKRIATTTTGRSPSCWWRWKETPRTSSGWRRPTWIDSALVIRSGLPEAVVRKAPTLAERMEADTQKVVEKARREKEKRTRLMAMRDEVRRLAEEDSWSFADWDEFSDGLDDLRYGTDEDDEDDEDDEWPYESEQDEPAVTRKLEWEVQEQGARPTGLLFYGSSPVLSTTGQLRVEAVRDLIEWSRTTNVTHAPIERR